MKYMRKTLTIALCMVFAVGFMMVSGLSVQKAFADDYKYTIKVYSGKEGYFGDKDIPENHVKEVQASYGDQVQIVTNDGIYVKGEKKADLKTTLLDNKTYKLKGVKESGHDNKEYLQSSTFNASGDMSFSAVYGMAGGMVKYTVQYLDGNGNALADPGEFYGMVDDKPVVSFKYIDGYTPNAYNLGKTLSANEAENVFVFTYTQGGGGTTTVVVNNGGAAGAGGAAGGAGAGDGTNIADGQTPAAGPADYVDLDDGQTPTSDGTGADGTDITDGRTPGTNWAAIGGGAALVAAIAAAVVVILRRKREEEA